MSDGQQEISYNQRGPSRRAVDRERGQTQGLWTPIGATKDYRLRLQHGRPEETNQESVKRSKAEIAWALKIAGIGAGPVDLSENKGDYLYGGR